MGAGWAIIHAFHVGEGSERKWAVPGVGEPKEEIKDWRKRVSDYNPDIE